MSFTTAIQIPSSRHKISHSDNILLMGSCFATSMGAFLQDHLFPIAQNPFGIIYHPLIIAQCLQRLQKGEKFTLADLTKKEELWHSWNHHGSFSHPDPELALKKINDAFDQAHQTFQSLDWLILTFGTAYGYRLKSNNHLVANCHKYPGNVFEKESSDLAVLIAEYEQLFSTLKNSHPDLNIIVTVSPIRHLKDGLVENNRSKAKLLLLAENLAQQFAGCEYFPSYEIMLDELRDYRFFDRDLIHPTPIAQEYIWKKFSHSYFDEATKNINVQLLAFQKAAAHRPLFPETVAHQIFLNTQIEKLKDFSQAHSFLDLSKLINTFEAQLK